MPAKPKPPVVTAVAAPVAPRRFVVVADAVGDWRRGDVIALADIPGGAERAAALVARGALVPAAED